MPKKVIFHRLRSRVKDLHALPRRLLRGSARLALVGLSVLAMTFAGLFVLLWYDELDVTGLAPALEDRIAQSVPGMKARFPGKLTAHRLPLSRMLKIETDKLAIRYTPKGKKTITAYAENVAIVVGPEILIAEEPVVKSINIGRLKATLPWSKDALDAELRKSSGMSQRLFWPDGFDNIQIDDFSTRLLESDRGLVHRLRIKSFYARQLPFVDKIYFGARVTLKRKAGQAKAFFKGSGNANGPWEMRGTLKWTGLDAIVDRYAPLISQPFLAMPASLSYRIWVDKHVNASAEMKSLPSWRGGGALSLRRLRAKLTWDGTDRIFKVRDFTATIPNGAITGEGAWRAAEAEAATSWDASVRIINMDVGTLVDLWPRNLVAGGRTWIARNIDRGNISSLDYHHDQMGQDHLTFSFSDLLVHYRRPMPPLRRVSGLARLRGDFLIFDVVKASVNGIRLQRPKIRLRLFDKSKREHLFFRSKAHGQIRNLLTVLDSHPLRAISPQGITPSKVKGDIDFDLRLDLPLLRNIGFEDVNYSATAIAKKLQLPDTIADYDISEGNLDFKIDPKGFVATGDANLDAQPLSVHWTHRNWNRKYPDHFKITANATAQSLKMLGYDFTNMIEGPIALNSELWTRGARISHGTISADLTDARSSILHYLSRKSPGIAGQVDASFHSDGDFWRFENFTASWPGMKATGMIRAKKDRNRTHVTLASAVIDRMELKGDLTFFNDQPIAVALESSDLDLQKALDRIYAPMPKTGKSQSTKAESPGLHKGIIQEDPWPDLVGIVTTPKAKLKNNVIIKSVTAQVEVRNNRIQKLEMKGDLEDIPVAMSVSSLDAGEVKSDRSLHISTDNAGALLRGLDLMRNSHGGRLKMDAVVSGIDPNLDISSGRFQLRDLRVKKTPAIAKLASLTSITSLIDQIKGRGIKFEKVTIPFRLKQGVFTINKAIAKGSAMGVTMNGEVSQNFEQLNLKGVIIPSYTLNSLVGKVPILGELLVGGKNEGLVGVSYSIKGDSRDPKVNVHSASFLAPGFLRKIFSGNKARIKRSSDTSEETISAPSADKVDALAQDQKLAE